MLGHAIYSDRFGSLWNLVHHGQQLLRFYCSSLRRVTAKIYSLSIFFPLYFSFSSLCNKTTKANQGMIQESDHLLQVMRCGNALENLHVASGRSNLLRLHI